MNTAMAKILSKLVKNKKKRNLIYRILTDNVFYENLLSNSSKANMEISSLCKKKCAIWRIIWLRLMLC